jgi:hypothetical protein
VECGADFDWKSNASVLPHLDGCHGHLYGRQNIRNRREERQSTIVSMVGLLADFVWPALILASRMRSLAPIIAGLIFEFLVLRFVFPMPWKKAAVVDLLMNAASGLAGVVLIPLAGFIWELFPGIFIYKLFNIGTFNPMTWAATCVMAVFISTGIEVLVVRFAFGFEITRRRFWCMALANLGSTAIAWASLQIHPPQL